MERTNKCMGAVSRVDGICVHYVHKRLVWSFGKSVSREASTHITVRFSDPFQWPVLSSSGRWEHLPKSEDLQFLDRAVGTRSPGSAMATKAHQWSGSSQQNVIFQCAN